VGTRTVSQLQAAAGISRNAAGKWRKVLVAEASAGEDAGRTAVVEDGRVAQ
jgi:hypothetical protein